MNVERPMPKPKILSDHQGTCPTWVNHAKLLIGHVRTKKQTNCLVCCMLVFLPIIENNHFYFSRLFPVMFR